MLQSEDKGSEICLLHLDDAHVGPWDFVEVSIVDLMSLFVCYEVYELNFFVPASSKMASDERCDLVD